jgi:hypothetical protein
MDPLRSRTRNPAARGPPSGPRHNAGRNELQAHGRDDAGYARCRPRADDILR